MADMLQFVLVLFPDTIFPTVEWGMLEVVEDRGCWWCWWEKGGEEEVLEDVEKPQSVLLGCMGIGVSSMAVEE